MKTLHLSRWCLESYRHTGRIKCHITMLTWLWNDTWEYGHSLKHWIIYWSNFEKIRCALPAKETTNMTNNNETTTIAIPETIRIQSKESSGNRDVIIICVVVLVTVVMVIIGVVLFRWVRWVHTYTHYLLDISFINCRISIISAI